MILERAADTMIIYNIFNIIRYNILLFMYRSVDFMVKQYRLIR